MSVRRAEPARFAVASNLYRAHNADDDCTCK